MFETQAERKWESGWEGKVPFISTLKEFSPFEFYGCHNSFIILTKWCGLRGVEYLFLLHFFLKLYLFFNVSTHSFESIVPFASRVKQILRELKFCLSYQVTYVNRHRSAWHGPALHHPRVRARPTSALPPPGRRWASQWHLPRQVTWRMRLAHSWVSTGRGLAHRRWWGDAGWHSMKPAVPSVSKELPRRHNATPCDVFHYGPQLKAPPGSICRRADKLHVWAVHTMECSPAL